MLEHLYWRGTPVHVLFFYILITNFALFCYQVLCVADSVLVPPIPSSGIPATSIPATATAAVPTETASTINAAAATPTDDDGDDGEDDGDDEDDDDLPYCDEL